MNPVILHQPNGRAVLRRRPNFGNGGKSPFPEYGAAQQHRLADDWFPPSNLTSCIYFLAILLFAGNFPRQAHAQPITASNVLFNMERVADWQLAHPSKHPPTDWTSAAGDAGFMALAQITTNTRYRDAMVAVGESNHWQPGSRFYHADDHCIGQTYCELYLTLRDPRMIQPLRDRFDAILAKPSDVASLVFTNPKASENWSWCDALFMGPPTWMRLYAATHDERYLNFAVTNWWRTADYLYDKDEHLFFRDSTYFDKREANGKKVFWSRGNGWVMAGLVRVLQYLPAGHPDRTRFETMFQEMAAKVLPCQQPDGLWHSSLLDPGAYPEKETSGSGFYTYALAWGLNHKLLDAGIKVPVEKAWNALTACVDENGKLMHVQPVGATPKSFPETSTDNFGVGAYLLAGSEVYRMEVMEKAN
jgi:rhamnogalacturonyl hydrolase YesR